MPQDHYTQKLNGWNEYQRLVMDSIETHTEQLGKISETLTLIRIEIGMLKVKAGVWGLLGGAIPAVGTILLILWKGHAE